MRNIIKEEFKIVNGIQYDQVISLIPKFDILTDEFIKHINDYWLKDTNLDSEEFNQKLVNEFKNNFWFKTHFPPYPKQYRSTTAIYENNGKTFTFVIGNGERLEKLKICSKEKVLLDMITFKEYMKEAINDGLSYTPLDNETHRKNYYNMAEKDPKIKEISPTVNLHKKVSTENGTTMTAYHSLDHNKKEAVHQSLFVKRSKTKEFPYDHEVQTQTHKSKNADLPKNYATNLAMEHFKKSKLPLRSSSNQYDLGHKMWHRLVDKALADNHHVYHWDGEKLHKTTEENKKDHLAKSFGKTPEFAHRHMVISKKELS